jgi:hypothetical protein
MKRLFKNFVTYEQALALKQLGFKEPCLARYNDNEFEVNLIISELCFNVTNSKMTYGNFKNYNIGVFEDEGTISAPFYSQAFDFIREKYDINSFIDSIYDATGFYLYEYHISTKDSLFGFNTNEDAESACLDKLIQLCKN